MFEWDDRYRLGVHSIDAQHQGLFAAAQELYRAMSRGEGRSALGKTLNRLVTYTDSHFAHEERLLEAHRYPGLEAHRAEHAELRKKVLQFQSDFRSGRTPAVQLLQLLRDWLQRHIQDSDQGFAPFLKR